MICPHCAKNIDIPSAAEIGRKGGKVLSPKKLAALRASNLKRWAMYRERERVKKELHLKLNKIEEV